MTATIRIATRGSALARWQAERVAALLAEPAELVVVSTAGDRDHTRSIHSIGGNGVFVKEVQAVVQRGDADLAVHSAKDMMAIAEPGLVLGAVPERADVRDALVGARLDAVPAGGTIATGSVRRRAQLASRRPDLCFAELRGNVPTRVERAADFDAVVVAVAALDRLGLADRAAEVLDVGVMLPMVGQGALAVECRTDDDATRERLRSIDVADLHRTLDAERAFLRELGGGCTMPCAALAMIRPDGGIHLDALLAATDGSTVLRTAVDGSDPESMGAGAARTILDELGGADLLAREVAS